jgi:antitoxin component YwqK of YwqJK toxin-antitoxin module
MGQKAGENVIYIVDSIAVIEDPGPDNEIQESEIADITVIKNKDSLKNLGYSRFDGAIFIFTKPYRNRPDQIKQIPSTRSMEKRNGVWYFRSSIYAGDFIDYYLSGKKEGEGTFKSGRVEGVRTMYFQDGVISRKIYYNNGIANGFDLEYYEDGSLKQKGEFTNGRETGSWEMYFPNGKVKQKSTFKDGALDGETTVYNSAGKILAIEVNKDGKTIPDKSLEKLNKLLSKGHESSRNGDFAAAIKSYTKAIELDSTYTNSYLWRGTAKLNELRFDEAILDFDRALICEPFNEKALTNRAFARIRKHQFGNSRQISQSNGITVMASKENTKMSDSDIALICSDLRQAMFLGDKGKMILEALTEFCEGKK